MKPGAKRGSKRLGHNALNAPRRVAAHQRDLQAVEMRARGCTFEHIAVTLGYASRGHVSQQLTKYWTAHPSPEVEELRKQEVWRLDMAQAALWDRVMAGDDAAVDRFVRVSKRRSEVTGMDAPPRAPVDEKGNAVGALALGVIRQILEESAE